ncbi:hypothetical protein GWK48_02260 [Metallosphaera tengchongensis]|uniref:DUF5622 domain-containing protein n=1 Tax=Metallosphaera tengchongensis TaxID=1532350 RepID=A0A6N0NW38_9CREN|nr:DUF5622 domain-containing protein [Metallosphaera tengchongensis]QKQ99369.1 hypothetical protein GWK48_02260 [Metallosphaera tengchongensis]
MSLKHGKYVYVEVGKSRYAVLRVLKSREENSADRYLVTGKVVAKKSRNAKILKVEDIPLEVRDKLQIKQA